MLPQLAGGRHRKWLPLGCLSVHLDRCVRKSHPRCGRDASEMHPWLKDGGSANRLHGINVVPMGDGRSRILLAGFNLYRFGSHDGIDDAMAWIGLLQMCWHTFCAAKLSVFGVGNFYF